MHRHCWWFFVSAWVIYWNSFARYCVATMIMLNCKQVLFFYYFFFGILVISNDLLLQSHGTLCLPFICQRNIFLPAGFILSDYLADPPRKCFELSRKACTKSEQVPVHLFKGCLLERCCSLPTKHAVIACIAVETTSWKQKLFKKNHLLTIFQFPKNTCVYTHMSRTWSVASKWYNVIELMGRTCTCTSVSIRVSCNVFSVLLQSTHF